MKLTYQIISLSLIGIFGLSLVKGYNQMNKENYEDSRGIINIDDDRRQGEYEDGSGAPEIDDGWNDYSGGDDIEDDETSGGGQLPCLELRKAMEENKLQDVHMPKCTPDGEYEPKQCDNNEDICWCVDSFGKKREGTQMATSARLTCDKDHYSPQKPDYPGPNEDSEEIDDNGIVFVSPPDQEIKNSIDAMPESDHNGITVFKMNNESNQLGMVVSENKYHNYSVMTQPGVLAAIIGGAVVGLLCAVLLVMFIVYRMRKKDEGSYALDEPKRSAPTHPYMRASTKEFFA